MDQANAEVFAFTAFPKAHWRKIWSPNPLERVNKESKRRSRVVGIFPILALEDRFHLAAGEADLLSPDEELPERLEVVRPAPRHADEDDSSSSWTPHV